jgi:MFS family permease
MNGEQPWRRSKTKDCFLVLTNAYFRMYNFATGSGVSIGIIISGIITLNNSWRVIYWAGAIMIGFLIILIVFTIPETAYNRSYDDSEKGYILEDKKSPYRLSLSIILQDEEKARIARYYQENDPLETLPEDSAPTEMSIIHRMEERIRRLEAAVLGNNQYSLLSTGLPAKRSYWSKLSLFTGEIYTQDSLWKMFIRPFGLIILPPVLWATLVMSALVGFTVALSSACELFSAAVNICMSLPAIVANDFQRVYNFTPFQAGLGFFGSLLGGILASESNPEIFGYRRFTRTQFLLGDQLERLLQITLQFEIAASENPNSDCLRLPSLSSQLL